MKIHAFNTGCHYTIHGQRIAWCVMDGFKGRVAMVDVDRGIEYVLICHSVPDVPITNSDVRFQYLNHYVAPYNAEEERAFRSIIGALREAAYAVKSLAPTFTDPRK